MSEKYRESLIVGYSCLPGFVPDEEAEAVKALFEKVDRETIEKMLNNPEQYHEETAEAARMIADTNVMEIIIRINTEGMDYLTELEKYDKQFCGEVNNDS